MSGGLLKRALRESWPATALLGLALFLVEVALAFALPVLERLFAAQLLRLTAIQNAVQALLGVDVSGGAGPELFASIAWVHPVVLALLWAHAAMHCTRVPAGEVDHGTIDVLLGLPVSRWRIYVDESLVWALSGLALTAIAVAGNVCGGLAGGATPDVRRLIIVGANLFCLYLTVGGFSWLVSALSDRRGRAIGSVFGVLLGFFLLNYLGQFWSLAARFLFLTPLEYFRPLTILRDGAWPAGDMCVLAGAGALFWLAGGAIFARRDLMTT